MVVPLPISAAVLPAAEQLPDIAPDAARPHPIPDAEAIPATVDGTDACVDQKHAKNGFSSLNPFFCYPFLLVVDDKIAYFPDFQCVKVFLLHGDPDLCKPLVHSFAIAQKDPLRLRFR